MSVKPLRLSRRAVLRGAGGIAIALPWLEAMEPTRPAFAAPSLAKRFVAVYQPGGTVLDQWTPTGTESSPVLSPILEPFEASKQDILVLSGIDMKSAVGEQDACGMIAWLTGTATAGAPSNYATSGSQGPSIDEVLADRLVGTRRMRSLNQAVRWGTGRSHGVATTLDTVSYGTDTAFTRVVPKLDPVAVWNDLFGDGAAAAGAWDRSILDALDRRYARLAARLGSDDRARLEQHLTAIRTLERGLPAVSASCSPPPLVDLSSYDPASGLNSADDGSIRDLPTDAAIPAVGKFMMDMLVMALACDITAVATLQWTDAMCQHTFPWLGLDQTHRFYMGDGGFRAAECTRIATWYSVQHAYLVAQMARVDMGGHSLLDESVVFFGSHLQHPPTHTKDSMPFLLAGRGGGLRPGRWLRYEHPSHNDLLVAILNLFGDTRRTFGTPDRVTGPLPNLT
jgi:hypothetical protein